MCFSDLTTSGILRLGSRNSSLLFPSDECNGVRLGVCGLKGGVMGFFRPSVWSELSPRWQKLLLGGFAVAVLFAVVAIMLQRDEFADEARTEALARCTKEKEAGLCATLIDTNHKACFRWAYHGGGKAHPASINHSIYYPCVMNGPQEYRAQRKIERLRQAREEAEIMR